MYIFVNPQKCKMLQIQIEDLIRNRANNARLYSHKPINIPRPRARI